MQWVQKAVQYYKDINPATLTGAIDVIVVERPTESGELELACSPFHVRFGKLSVLRPIDKKVRITVNDEPIPFYMKVGETGEAFFVFETDADVPADLQTSPLASPVPDSPLDGEEPGEPEFLDLDAGPRNDEEYESPLSSSPSSSRYASFNGTQLNSPTQTIRTLSLTPFANIDEQSPPPSPTLHGEDDSQATTLADENEEEANFGDGEGKSTSAMKAARPIPSAIVKGTEKLASLGKAALTGLSSSIGGEKKLEDLSRKTLEEERENLVGKGGEEVNEEGQAHSNGTSGVGDLSSNLDGLNLDEEEERKGSVGEEVRRAARKKDKDLTGILGVNGLGRAKSFGVGEEEQLNKSAFELKKPGFEDAGETELFNSGKIAPLLDLGAPEKTSDLMLDMSGYKLESTADEKANDPAKLLLDDQPSNEINAPFDDHGEEEIVAFTQGLLQSTDPKTLRGFFDPSDSEADSSRAASPTPPLEPESTPSIHLPRPNSLTSLRSLVIDSQDIPERSSSPVPANRMEFSVRVGGRLHVFELSLCGGVPDFGQSAFDDAKSFQDSQVSYQEFIENEKITDHANLVVKYNGRYLTWENASPVLASLAVFRKSLIDHPEHHKRLLLLGQEGEEGAKRPSRWGLWWNRKVESTTSLPTQDTSPPVSPPVSTPASPRSLPLPASPPPMSPPVIPIDDVEDKKHYAKTLRLTSDQLKELGLKKGMNVISFSVRSSYSGYATCTSRVFLWESDYQVVISDIDGTITKSDALGHVFTMIGRDWTHLGVAKLYTDIARNGYKMMYLTSRAIGQADTTREYLKGIRQNGFQLPEGPVIMSPDRLMTSLHREVIMRKPEVFKMACLRDIQRLFGERSPFYAGFGNRITDALSYRSVDVPSSRIFTIDSGGEVKMELLELAGYKSSYIHMHDLVDQMFPPINRTTAPAFTDFNFWRAPMLQFDIPDLAPPSPALSARSDSNSGRLGFPRLGSIASSLSRRSSRGTLTDPPSAQNNRLARNATPSSPLLQATVVEEFDLNDEMDEDRSESESMPGSLPNGSDFERYRRDSKQRHLTEAEAYKEQIVTGEEPYEEEDLVEEEDFDDGAEDVDELDFSSVPYL